MLPVLYWHCCCVGVTRNSLPCWRIEENKVFSTGSERDHGLSQERNRECHDTKFAWCVPLIAVDAFVFRVRATFLNTLALTLGFGSLSFVFFFLFVVGVVFCFLPVFVCLFVSVGGWCVMTTTKRETESPK